MLFWFYSHNQAFHYDVIILFIQSISRPIQLFDLIFLHITIAFIILRLIILHNVAKKMSLNLLIKLNDHNWLNSVNEMYIPTLSPPI